MNKEFVPFNRYRDNLRIHYIDTDRNKIDPLDYNTSVEEIEWYVNSLLTAQKENDKYIQKVKKRLSYLCVFFFIAFCFYTEKIFNTDPLWYIGAGFACIIFTPIILLIIWQSSKLDKWLRYIYRDMFFPPICPNIESFLFEYKNTK